MGISDFGQVSRLISKWFQRGISPSKAGKRRLRVARSACCGWISKAEARTEVIRALCEQTSYEMNKCLSLVHLTSTFRIHSRVSAASKPRNPRFLNQFSTARLGCCWPIGLAPAAIGATGGAGQHWLSWRSNCFGGLLALRVDWAWVFVQVQRRWVPRPKPSPRSAGLSPIERLLRRRFRRYCC